MIFFSKSLHLELKNPSLGQIYEQIGTSYQLLLILKSMFGRLCGNEAGRPEAMNYSPSIIILSFSAELMALAFLSS